MPEWLVHTIMVMAAAGGRIVRGACCAMDGMAMRVGLAIAAIVALAGPAEAIEICKGGDRAARGVTCLVDGDTLWQDGVKMRLLDIDAPETFDADCGREKDIGDLATERMQELMAHGYKLKDSGRKDRTSDKRTLVRVVLPDGRDAGQVLISEGLAQPWPNRGNKWCGR
ncbi:endonuclease YncB(thermonuclease family) [Pseudorhizobium tarimense]|uniref:Endonuclease YncB(Thermonuclease family) n=2 Tax=Pseudorhizobium tarimense TaxID=1079109 RepID=A0ABV2HBD2_9HYPH